MISLPAAKPSGGGRGFRAHAVGDAVRRQLTYKAAQRGVQLVVVDRWFASSKACSHCEAINDALTLSDRTWTCTG